MSTHNIGFYEDLTKNYHQIGTLFLLLNNSVSRGSVWHHMASLLNPNSDMLRKNKKLAASKAYSIPPAMCRSKPCKFVNK